MITKQLPQPFHLCLGEALIDQLFRGDQIFRVLAEFAEKFFNVPSGLENLKNTATVFADATPHMRRFTRDENRSARPKPKLFIANAKFEIALQNVNPLVLFVMQVLGAAAAGGELESAHRAVGI